MSKVVKMYVYLRLSFCANSIVFFALHSPKILVQQGTLQNLLYHMQVNTPFEGTSYHQQNLPLPNLRTRHHLCYFHLLIVSIALNQLNSSLVPILSSRDMHKCPTSQW